MTRFEPNKLLLGLFFSLGVAMDLSAGPQIKCWTNNEGVRECGNAVPPEYAQRGYAQLSRQGIEVARQERAKTQEELEEERRIARLKEENERQFQAAARADRALLNTFSSEQDLLLARDGQLASIEGQIRLMEEQLQKLKIHLDKAISTAAEMKRRAESPPEKLLAEINAAEQQIKQGHASIEVKRKEQETVRQRFEADLKRFRELTGRH